MSKIIHVSSKTQFSELLSSSSIVIADFYADWCGPCKVIAPLFEQLANKFSRPNKVSFIKVNVDANQDVAQAYGVTAMPTFLIFKNGAVTDSIRGANPPLLTAKIQEFASSVGSNGSGADNAAGEASGGNGGASWLGGSAPKGYSELCDQIEIKGIDLLNCDNQVGPGRSLFAAEKPSGFSTTGTSGNGKDKASSTPDWVESDTDEQLMLYIPFQSSIKIHSLQITSLAPRGGDGDADDDVPMRPKTLKLYTNRTHIIGFEDADDETPTQEVELKPQDWDEKTKTATVELRFVKFQRITSLVVYFVDGDGDGERIRVDRVRIFGEAGERREMGKLEKIGDEPGE
ncbi:thioredoxin [Emergomyces pasteurianus Ep9510]|uniref:Thioredoxin n=1 Tax=Emergomyces pasteurianus Ep9510 TaxID=1447872 RepID=A0A1J9PE08_9EURO|nr:thioredoxin [Emergomyces pasteurianus Ep9510]